MELNTEIEHKPLYISADATRELVADMKRMFEIVRQMKAQNNNQESLSMEDRNQCFSCSNKHIKMQK